ncbi:unnamed protein product [Notodromas monacha]|uniref:Cytochrome b561 domain-containing protein n=1 Tax=Notodromas monacha TaxID=399045 RepID=A0A7R9BBW2_9CRUS|nr:unnamed protein product [Notodromas monacha]CAG0912405.1 unnamed protein product [Notodromas monacha]
MEQSVQELIDFRWFTVCYSAIQIIGILIIALLIAWLTNHCGGFAWAAHPQLQFNWHPLLMVVGMIYMYANDFILSINPSRRIKMEQSVQELIDFRWFTVCYSAIQIIGILIIALLIAWLTNHCGGFAWAAHPQLQFNWHPLLMVVGMIYMYANGMLVYRVFRTERKRKLKIVHAVAQLFTFFLFVIGLKAVFDAHEASKTPNLYSLHSWFGIWVAGFLSFLFPGIKHAFRSKYLPIHTLFGLIIFSLSCITALMGLLEKAVLKLSKDNLYEQLGSEAVLINVTGIFILIFGMLAIFITAQPGYKRKPLPEDELLLTDAIHE